MTTSEDVAAARLGARHPIPVAVIGTGAIGQDLVSKIHRSPVLDCALVAGRSSESAGLRHASRLGYPTSVGGIGAILVAPRPFGVVFDATNAMSHAEHYELMRPSDTLLIDLTPSRIGQMVVPTVTGTHAPAARDVSLISCGGQASIPIAHALASHFDVGYIEVVSTVASEIAGRATRLNLDEYVATTQHAVTRFSGVRHTKAVLNISPAVPPAIFLTTVYAIIAGADAERAKAVVTDAAEQVRGFAPGYKVADCAVSADRVAVCLEVMADSDVLPAYAGNLDLINSAAILVAEQHAGRLQLAARLQPAAWPQPAPRIEVPQ
jgi:acetaldehyde dehydrogenase